jgi:membrane-bound lytic murein transglycosylase MltF
MLDAEARLKYGLMILKEIRDHFPALLTDFERGELIIHAQIWQESRWNPNAQSPVGAAGLLQLMPATDFEIDGDYDGFDAAGNLDNGIRYLAYQYSKFPEIPDPAQRIRFALASYNCGRGYINKALEMARSVCGIPNGSYAQWVRMEKPSGDWQKWPFVYPCLSDHRCEVNGKLPDYRQVTDYVHKIFYRYYEYLSEVKG